MDGNDPIDQFFPGQEEIDLYTVLSLQKGASPDAVKKAYRKLALVYHPDKHANASEKTKEESLIRFQQIGFAYAVLSDPKRKARYDSTGKTDEGFDLCAGEDGWQTYFEELFDRVTRGKLDEMKQEYQGISRFTPQCKVSNVNLYWLGSAEEINDLKEAYNNTSGDFVEIMSYIPHSTHEDEPRFITIITDLIKRKELKYTSTWGSTSKDEKAKLARKKDSEKEAREAEELAEELGVWNEFYGDGKAADRKKGKNKGKTKGDEEAEEDHSVLQALILKKKEKDMEGFFDGLAAKYSETAPKKGRGKKRGHDFGEDDVSTNKKTRPNIPPPPELDDEEFARIQKKLFSDKGSSTKKTEKKGNRRKAE